MKTLAALFLIAICLTFVSAVPPSCSAQGAVAVLEGAYQPGSSQPDVSCDTLYKCLHTCSACPEHPLAFQVRLSSTWNPTTSDLFDQCRNGLQPCTCQRFYTHYLGYSQGTFSSSVSSPCRKHCAQFSKKGTRFSNKLKPKIYKFAKTKWGVLEQKAEELEQKASVLEKQAEEYEQQI